MKQQTVLRLGVNFIIQLHTVKLVTKTIGELNRLLVNCIILFKAGSVKLFADIFKKCRRVCLREDCLDLVHYLTTRGIAP